MNYARIVRTFQPFPAATFERILILDALNKRTDDEIRYMLSLAIHIGDDYGAERMREELLFRGLPILNRPEELKQEH